MFILVGLATLMGSSRLILVGLGNLRFLQVNGVESVAFITILPRVSIIYSDSQHYNDYMNVVAVFTL